MDLKQIRYLIAVSDAGSFSAGARKAYVTQPTLSAAIAALEAELGVQLFERLPRGVALTAEGSRILDHARVVLRETEVMKAAATPVKRERPLRLGLLPTMPPRLVADVLTNLKVLDPSLTWITEDAASLQLRQRLANGRYDAIVTALGKAKRSYRRVTLARDAQALAFAEASAPKGRITPKILQQRPLIVRTHCEQLHAASRILDDWNVRPRVVARTSSDSRALAMVAAGVGACLMPDSYLAAGIVFVRPQGVNLTREIGLEWIRGAGAGRIDAIAPQLAR